MEWERRAAVLYRDAAERDPDSLDTAYGYADTLLEMGQLEIRLRDSPACPDLRQARQIFSRLAAVSPRDAIVRSKLARADMAACR